MNPEKFERLVDKWPWLLYILRDRGEINPGIIKEQIRDINVRPWIKLNPRKVPCSFTALMTSVEFDSIPFSVSGKIEIVYCVHLKTDKNKESFTYFVRTSIRDDNPKSIQEMFDELDEQGGIVDAVVVTKFYKCVKQKSTEEIARESHEIYFPIPFVQDTIGVLSLN